MICRYCDKEISSKIYYLHVERCPMRYDYVIKEANEITLDKATKTDLIVYIMSESDTEESKIKRMTKAQLYDIAKDIKG